MAPAAPGRGHGLVERRAVLVAQGVEVVRVEPAAHRPASDAAQAEPRGLLAGKHESLERSPGGDAGLPDRPQRLDRAEDPKDAVVLARVRNRVRVRAADDGGKGVVLAREPAKDVPHTVLSHLQACIAHQALDVVPGPHVVLRVQNARYGGRRGVRQLAQRLYLVEKPLGRDPLDGWGCGRRRCQEDGDEAQQREGKGRRVARSHGRD
mmetsp:Transcript_6185/g.18726  ORF Transcript_6185/g.18726 Transcript_6185/m.18726 type:complete len:208 (-) Transcript_6185:61-684(-)